MRTSRLLPAVIALVVVAAGCSTGGATSTGSPAPAVSATSPSPSLASPVPSETTPPSSAASASPSAATAEASPSGGTDAGGSAAETVEVAIRDFAFQPETITVAPGQTVRWTNFDGEPHTVRADDGSIASPILAKEPFEWTAPMTPGTIAYVCSIHPKMKGTIEIQG